MHGDMTTGKPRGAMLRFALPLMLTALFQQLYTLADGAIVGRLLGAEAFAAVGSAARLHLFPLSMIMGLSHGFGVVFAQRFGAKDAAAYRRALATGLLLACGIALTLSALGIGFLPAFLSLLKTPVALVPMSDAYLRVLWCGLIATAASNVLAAALRAAGDSATPCVALAIASCANIALDFLFIAAFGMGAPGAALSTVLAEVLAVGICLRKLARNGRKGAADGDARMLPRRTDFVPRRADARELMRLGIPPLLSSAVISTGDLAVQAAINARGVPFLAGMTAARRYYPLLVVVGSGLEGALATFVAQNKGAGQNRRILEGVKTAVRLGVASALVTGALVVFASRPLIELLLPEATAEMLETGVRALRAETAFLGFLYLLCLYRAAIQGLGRALVPMLSGFLELAARLLCVASLVFFSREALYFTDAAPWVITALMLLICYMRERGKLRRVL